jgi:hypothetical protein
MNTQRAYISGFVKRASEYGFNEEEAATILKEASTRYMREFRAGTPAGKKVEEAMIARMGVDNTDLLKNNPRGISRQVKTSPKVNPELAGNLLKGIEGSIERDPDIAKFYGGISKENLLRMEAANHIKEMTRLHIRGTLPQYPSNSAMYPEAQIDPISGNTGPIDSQQKKINLLGAKAKKRPEHFNSSANIGRANYKNYQAAQQAAYRAAQGMKETVHTPLPTKGISETLAKLKGLFRRK